MAARRPVFVPGICLLAVFEGARVAPSTLIYVRRLGHTNGIWYDDIFHEPRDDPFDSALDKETHLYNLKFRPLDRADFLFDRSEDPTVHETPTYRT